MNKNNPHTVFQTRANYGDWDKYIEQIDLIKLSKKQRQNFRESVGFLRVLFGENYLKRCLRDHHPFMSQMMNAVPVARLEFIKFAQSVKDLTDCPGINKLVKKFTRTKLAVEYIEALTVLESAHSFYKAGFSLEIEPEIEVQLPSGESRKKYPDLKLTNPQNNEEIFVEVSQLKVSDNEINSTATYTKIWREVHNSIDEHTVVRHDNSEKAPVFHHNILPYVKILRAFEPEELNRVVEEINEIITLALKTQTFQELILKDQIEMAVAPAHEHAQARGWAQSRNLKDFVEGPPDSSA